MIVGDLDLFLIELPASDGALRTLLLRVGSESGAEGWGETRKNWHPGELPARRKGLLAVLAGREIHDIESIMTLDVLADHELACAVEMALWDLVAQSARQPLCHLLGGGYRQSVPLAVRLPAGPPESVAHWARVFSAQAIASQTIRSTGSPDADLKLVSALREACSDRVQFRFDAHRQYPWRVAARLCAQLEPGSVEYVLDPVSDGQLDLLAGVRASARVPLAAFEIVRRPGDVMQLARAGAVACVLVDPVLVGGLAAARRCAAVADAGGMAAGIRIDGTSGLALAATLQLAAATPSFAGGHECSYPKLHDDILAEPLRMVDGMLAVPMAPGLGVQVDRDKVDWYQVGA
ncbi:MAG: enolase C-terminal domain-like protein [Pirellulales bacterium]